MKLRYDDFRIATRELTLSTHTDDAKTIRHAAGLCVKRVSLDRKLRLLGVRVGTLCKADALPAEDSEPASTEPPADNTLPLFGVEQAPRSTITL